MPPSAVSLLGQIRSYRGAAAETAILDRFVRLLEGAADPFSRDNHDHVTASAVIARSSGGEALLRFHRKLGRWLQPGGHVEPEDASVFDAALREAREETGILDFRAPMGDRILDLDVHDIPGSKDQPPHRHYDVRYLLIAPAGSEASDAHRTRWVRFEALAGEDTEASLARASGKAQQWLEHPTSSAPPLN